jgi:hypothetical protein
MIIDTSKLPQFTRLIEAFFHQDWDLDHESPDAVLAFYKEHSSEKDCLQLEKDLSWLIQNNDLKEADYQMMFDNLGLSYDYLTDWSSSKAWLAHMKEEIA